jgi:hypothetical protein
MMKRRKRFLEFPVWTPRDKNGCVPLTDPEGILVIFTAPDGTSCWRTEPYLELLPSYAESQDEQARRIMEKILADIPPEKRGVRITNMIGKVKH